MIKLRVEWHCKCPGCGTELVVDYLVDSLSEQICPWCGARAACEKSDKEQMRDFLTQAVERLENEVNSSPTCAG